MNARKLIIDCDPGIDDSLALMLAAASKELDLVGITTVSGNVPASMGDKNALKFLSLIGKPDVPVYVGEETPLVRDYVDIVFANEDEAKTFTCEAEPLNALQVISEMCELAVVKIGIKGAMIKQGDEVVHVGIMAAAKRVDTTGAGDFYAAGFLSGLCDGLSLRQCGTIGAITAGKVIEVVGTTFGEEAWEDISRLVNKVKNEKYLF